MLKSLRNSLSKPTLFNAVVVNLSPNLPITAPATSPCTALLINVPVLTTSLNVLAVFAAFVAADARRVTSFALPLS